MDSAVFDPLYRRRHFSAWPDLHGLSEGYCSGKVLFSGGNDTGMDQCVSSSADRARSH